MRTPSHGYGQLQVGGTPGNKGGGRPRSAVRDAALLAFDERIPVLEEIADDKKAKPADRIRAVDALGKHGGAAKEEAIPSELVRLLAEDVQAVARSTDFVTEFAGERKHEEEEADAPDLFLSRVYDRWLMTLGAFRARTG